MVVCLLLVPFLNGTHMSESISMGIFTYSEFTAAWLILSAYSSGATPTGRLLDLCNIYPMSSMLSLNKEHIFMK